MKFFVDTHTHTQRNTVIFDGNKETNKRHFTLNEGKNAIKLGNKQSNSALSNEIGF